MITGAAVDLLNRADLEKTNDKGIFEVTKVTGFCKDPLIIVSSAGYKPSDLKNK